jgi:SAM-dependent methyltransferase
MTDQQARYDRIAEGYATWWAPVLAPAAFALLDLVAAEAQDSRRLVDVGTGTGTLAIAAAARWPHLEILAVDASEAMLSGAHRQAAARLGDPASPARTRLRIAQGTADRLPPDADGSDLVVSSFVYQLVPSRGRALREARRVLRPGGRLAYVTWLDGEVRFAGDRALDEALAAAGLEPRGDLEEDGRAGDVPSVRAAADQLRRAGFRNATAHAGIVRHDFSPRSWLGFLAEFDEEDLFESLDPGARARLEHELLGRLEALSPDELRLELPVVYATGVRPGDGGEG